MPEVYTPLRTETPAQEIDRRMAELTVLANRREQVLRLYKNRDFKALILQFFLVDEASRYVQVSQQPGISAEASASALAIAQSTGHFKRFLDVVERMGESAIAQLEEYRVNYNELTQPEDPYQGEAE